jgi:hypothetical protein
MSRGLKWRGQPTESGGSDDGSSRCWPGPSSAGPGDVPVGTVDKFQGREAPVVLFDGLTQPVLLGSTCPRGYGCWPKDESRGSARRAGPWCGSAMKELSSSWGRRLEPMREGEPR